MAATLMEILAVGERDHVLNRAGDLAAALFDWSQRLQAAIAARDVVEVERLAGIYGPSIAGRAADLRRSGSAPAWPDSIRLARSGKRLARGTDVARCKRYERTGKVGHRLDTGIPSAEYQGADGAIVWLDADRNIHPE